MNEHLTVQELLTAMKHCMNWPKNGFSCEGCPNAVPGTKDKDGFCQCRFDTYDEVIRILETLVQNEK